MRSQISGFTLLELMVTIFVMVILLGIGVPSYIQFKEDQTLLGAAQTLYGDIQLARSETIKRRSNDMFILFVSSDLNIPSYERGVARVLGYDLPT